MPGHHDMIPGNAVSRPSFEFLALVEVRIGRHDERCMSICESSRLVSLGTACMQRAGRVNLPRVSRWLPEQTSGAAGEPSGGRMPTGIVERTTSYSRWFRVLWQYNGSGCRLSRQKGRQSGRPSLLMSDGPQKLPPSLTHMFL
jgi:hypothetical protein